jgi:hypothetical protein
VQAPLAPRRAGAGSLGQGSRAQSPAGSVARSTANRRSGTAGFGASVGPYGWVSAPEARPPATIPGSGCGADETSQQVPPGEGCLGPRPRPGPLPSLRSRTKLPPDSGMLREVAVVVHTGTGSRVCLSVFRSSPRRNLQLAGAVWVAVPLLLVTLLMSLVVIVVDWDGLDTIDRIASAGLTALAGVMIYRLVSAYWHVLDVRDRESRYVSHVYFAVGRFRHHPGPRLGPSRDLDAAGRARRADRRRLPDQPLQNAAGAFPWAGVRHTGRGPHRGSNSGKLCRTSSPTGRGDSQIPARSEATARRGAEIHHRCSRAD